MEENMKREEVWGGDGKKMRSRKDNGGRKEKVAKGRRESISLVKNTVKEEAGKIRFFWGTVF